MRWSYLWFFVVALQLGYVTSFQQRGFTNSVAFSRTDDANNRVTTLRPSTCLWEAKNKVDRKTAWNAKYQELVEFKKKHGHLKVKHADNKSLYIWMKFQRSKRDGKLKPLTDDQIRLLDEIDFQWDMKRNTAWNERYQELIEFKKKHGHFNAEYNSSLYLWQQVQRRKRKGQQKYTPLTDDQIRLLDEIDFPWVAGKVRTTWDANYKKLADFYEEHGHSTVKKAHPLYTWTLRQRQKKAGSYSLTPLTNEQIQLLDDLDFAWDALRGPNGTGWKKNYQELADFYKEHGHLNVDRKRTLYHWMNNQRRSLAGTSGRRKLTDEEIRLLDEIGFISKGK